MKNLSILFSLALGFALNTQAQNQSSKNINDKINIYGKQMKSIQNELQDLVSKKGAAWSAPVPFDVTAKLKGYEDGTLWTKTDNKELTIKYKHIVDKAKNQAKLSSKKIGLNLENIRSKNLEAQFCADLPKGGMLHVHPWGTLDLETLKLILVKQNPLIDLAQIKQLAEVGLDENADGKIDSTLPKTPTLSFLNKISVNEKLEGTKIRYSNLSEEDKALFHDLFFIKDKAASFTEFMGVFSVIFNTVFKKDSFSDFKFKVDEAMWSAFLTRAQKEKISYVEVTQTVNSKSGVDKYANLKKTLKEKYGVTVNSIASLDRRQSPEAVYAQVQDVLSLPANDAIVGVNLVANEDLHPAIQFKDAYSLLAQKRKTTHPQLSSTIHAGEKGDLYNVRNALAMGVQRIGHGVLLKNDLLTLEYVRQNKIPIEINVISNLLLDVSPSVEEHPFLYYHRLGIPVNISTDDEGIFQSTLSKECELIVKKTDIYYSELKEIILNSIRSSFAVETEKKQLLTQLEEDLKQFEKKYSLANKN